MTPEELDDAGLAYAVDGAVATITLNRPAVKNAQHPRLWAGMVRLLESLDDDVRIVVVRGAGGTFSAGLDLSLLDPSRADEAGSLITTAMKSAASRSQRLMSGSRRRPRRISPTMTSCHTR